MDSSLFNEPDVPPALSQLRAAVDAAHEESHRLPLFEPLMSGRITIGDYARVLRAFHCFHALSIRIDLSVAAGMNDDMAAHAANRRLVSVRSDLQRIGARVIDAEPLAPSADADWNIGYAYVVRGSALGGRVLHRALDDAPDWARAARSFFAGDGEARRGWSGFRRALSRETVDGRASGEQNVPLMIKGALAAFAQFRSCAMEETHG